MVARRNDPERIDQAKKAATIERLVGEGRRLDRVVRGRGADMHRARGDPNFWDNASHFARGEYDRDHRPPPAPDASSDERDPAF